MLVNGSQKFSFPITPMSIARIIAGPVSQTQRNMSAKLPPIKISEISLRDSRVTSKWRIGRKLTINLGYDR